MRQYARPLFVLFGFVVCVALWELPRGMAQFGGIVEGKGARTWEYKVLNFNIHSDSPNEWAGELNRVGADGWELVSSSMPGANSNSCYAFLKRAKR